MTIFTPHAPISWGELIDKITILEIKKKNIAAPKALININKELNLLNKITDEHIKHKNIEELKLKLKEINFKLWKIEDDIRELEYKKTFDENFIKLARSVYLKNDERAKIKREINEILKSELKEEKSYKNFRGHEIS